jgi:hypothetical protein
MPLFASKNKEVKKEEIKKLIPKIEVKKIPVQPIVEDTDDDYEEDLEDDEQEDNSFDKDVFDSKEQSDEVSREQLQAPEPTYSSIEEIKLALKKFIRRKCEIDDQLKIKRIIEKSDQTQMGLKTETMMMNEGDEVQLLIQQLELKMQELKVPDKEIEDVEREALAGIKGYKFIR